MRIAVLIISLCLVAIIGLQSCTVLGLSGAAVKLSELSPQAGDAQEIRKTQEGAAVGVLVAFLFLLGGAFAIGAPTVSAVVLAIAALFGFSFSGAFPDLLVWGGIAFALAVMSWFGRREAARKRN